MTLGATSTLVDRLRSQRAVAPGHLAIDAHHDRWTYAEAFDTAEALAVHLQRIGVRPGDAVVIIAPISVGAAIAMLGVLLAGGVMVPLPDHLAASAVRERRAVSGARFAIAVGSGQEATGADIILSNDGRTVAVTANAADGAPDTARAPEPTTDPVALGNDAPAYVFFTSGTTGRVRGVLGIHGSLEHFLDWQAAAFAIGNGDRVAFLTALGFDVVLRNVFLPWLVGATLVVPPPLGDFDDVIGWLAAERVTVVHLTPSMAENWISASRSATVSSSLRRTFFSGETLFGPAVQRWRDRVGSEQVINLYGPTETCMIRTAYTVPPNAGDGPLPAGRPMPGTTITLDRSIGADSSESGEVVIHTLYGTLGYIGEPELWLAAATPGTRPGEWTYRTGDLGRLGDDGELIIEGRCTDEVKVNGHRVDPADIAARVRRLGGVVSAAAFVAGETSAERELVVAVVGEHSGVTAASVRSLLADELPPALVPRWVAVVESLPLTPNGKIDRAAVLSKAQQDADALLDEPVDLSVLDAVMRLWGQVFRHDGITPTSNFFELGGHSMQIIRVLHELRERYGVAIPLRTLYLADTPTLVAREVQRARTASNAGLGQGHRGSVGPPAENRVGSNVVRLPARKAQRLFLDLHGLDASLASSVLIVARTVTGALDLGALQRALDHLVERHDALRTWFDASRQEQLVADSAVIGFEFVEALGVDDRTIDGLLRSRVAPDLESWPLVRPILIQHAADCWVVALVAQHAVVDSRSQDILIDDLRRLYEAEITGTAPELAPLPCSARDVVEHERLLESTGVLAADVAFWQQHINGRPLTMALSTDRPRSTSVIVAGAEVRARASARLRRDLEALAREGGGTLFRVLAGLWSAFLAGLTGDEDMVLTTPAMTREVEGAASMCGMYVMRIPLVLSARPEQTVSEVVAGAVAEVSLAGRHRHAHIGDLVGRAGPSDFLRTAPLHVAVNLLGWRERSPVSDGMGTRWDWYPDGAERPMLELELRALASEGTGLTFLLRYDANVHGEQSMATMIGDFIAFCEAALGDVHQTLAELTRRASASTDVQCPQLLTSVENTDSDLNRRVHEIAGALVAADVGAGDIVALALPPGLDASACILAAYRIGAVSLPLELDDPTAWNAAVLDAAKPVVLLADRAPAFACGDLRTVRLDRPGTAFPCVTAARSGAENHPGSLIAVRQGNGSVSFVQVPRSEFESCVLAEMGANSADRVCDALRSLASVRRAPWPVGALAPATAAAAVDAPAPRREPAGPMQEWFWLLRQLDDRDLYQMQCTWEISPGIDEPTIRAAVAAIVGRHDVLRTRFEYGGASGLMQCIDPIGQPWWRAVDEGDEPSLIEEMTLPFDLEREWPARFGLSRNADGGARLHLVAHHIAGDAASLPVLTRDLRAACGLAGSTVPAEPALQYGARVQSEREYLAGGDGRLAIDEAFWAQQMGGLADPQRALRELPGAAPSQVSRSRSVGERSQVERMLRACGSMRTTSASLVIAAAAVVASRVHRQDDVVIGVPVSVRSLASELEVVGPLVNTLPLRLSVRGQQTFADLAAQVSAVLAECLDHRDLPLERIVNASGTAGGALRIDWVVNVLDGQALGFGETGEIRLVIPDRVPVGARFDVTLTVLLGETLTVTADVNDAVDGITADGLIAAVTGVLENALADPAQLVARIGMLGAAGQAERDAERRSTVRALPSGTVGELLAEVVRRYPNRPAVVDGGLRFTYTDLERESESIARRLAAAGVRAGSAVGLLLDRSFALVASIAAVTRLHAVYVPLDTAQPAPRTEQMLDSAGVRAVIRGGGDDLVIESRRRSGEPTWPPVLPGASEREPGDLPLYAMFTSGSTGAPKGVVVPHRAVTRLVRDTDYLQLGPDDVVALSSNPAFDASTWEVWGALLNGSCLAVFAADTMASPTDYEARARHHGVTAAFVTTALLHVVAALRPGAFASVRTLLFGGERCDPAAVRSVLALRPGRRLVHVYGPTECTTFALWRDVGERDVERRSVPIGGPIRNTQPWVLDAAGHEVPAGVTGELFLGGAGLALGYLNDNELTSSRFAPLANCTGRARAYRTGDLVQIQPDGALDFVGRIDRQVKVRGFRVQPEEIESAMLSHPSVSAALVVTERSSDGTRLLGVAQSTTLTPSALRHFLVSQLPAAMIPGSLFVVPVLPLNANGKLDRTALSRVAQVEAEVSASPVVQCADAEYAGGDALGAHAYAVVSALWCAALGIDGATAAARDASFFDLGGHSLLAVRLLADIERATGAHLSLSVVLAHPTLRSLSAAVAAELSRRNRSGRRANLLELRPGSRPPLCLVPPASGHLLNYAELVPQLATGRQVLGLAARGVERRGFLHLSLQSMGRAHGRVLASAPGAEGLVVVGFSSGALVAVEVVRALQESGKQVGALVLLDPSGEIAAPVDAPDATMPTQSTPSTPPTDRAAATTRLRSRILRRARISARYRWSLVAPHVVVARVLGAPFLPGRQERSELSLAWHTWLVRRFVPQPLLSPVRTLVVVSADAPDPERAERARARWSAVVGVPVEVAELQGAHVGPNGILAGRRAVVAASTVNRFLAEE